MSMKCDSGDFCEIPYQSGFVCVCVCISVYTLFICLLHSKSVLFIRRCPVCNKDFRLETRKAVLRHLNLTHPTKIKCIHADKLNFKPSDDDSPTAVDEVCKRVYCKDLSSYILYGFAKCSNKHSRERILLTVPDNSKHVDENTVYHYDNGFKSIWHNCAFMQFRGYPWCVTNLDDS